MTLHDIPTPRLEEALKPQIYPHGADKIFFALYTQDGLETLEATAGQVRTEIAIRKWRQN